MTRLRAADRVVDRVEDVDDDVAARTREVIDLRRARLHRDVVVRRPRELAGARVAQLAEVGLVGVVERRVADDRERVVERGLAIPCGEVRRRLYDDVVDRRRGVVRRARRLREQIELVVVDRVGGRGRLLGVARVVGRAHERPRPAVVAGVRAELREQRVRLLALGVGQRGVIEHDLHGHAARLRGDQLVRELVGAERQARQLDARAGDRTVDERFEVIEDRILRGR